MDQIFLPSVLRSQLTYPGQPSGCEYLRRSIARSIEVLHSVCSMLACRNRSRFSGAEHMHAGAPSISPLPSKIDSPNLIRSISLLRSRCIKTIEYWVAIPTDQYRSDRCCRLRIDFGRLRFSLLLFAPPSSFFFCLYLPIPEEKMDAR